MLPDSTVTDPKRSKKRRKGDKGEEDAAPLKKTKKKAEPARKKPLKKKAKKKVDEEDAGSDLDLDKELHPLSYHIRHRRELVRQMFSSLKKTKVKSMLPEILKGYSLGEMEDLCYEEIQVMSRKRIAALLLGKRSNDISSSGTDDNSSDSDDVRVVEKRELDHPDSTGVTKELPNLDDGITKVASQSIMASPSKAVNKKLEILELEMRARAIKKMLMSQQAEIETDDEIQEVEVNKSSIEAEILKRMAHDQSRKTDDSSSRRVVHVAKGADSLVQAQIRAPAGRRTASELEPGELSDDADNPVKDFTDLNRITNTEDFKSLQSLSLASQPSFSREQELCVDSKSGENAGKQVEDIPEPLPVKACRGSGASDSTMSANDANQQEYRPIEVDRTAISEGEISNSDSEGNKEDDEEADLVKELCDAAVYEVNNQHSVDVQSKQIEDIFVDKGEFDNGENLSDTAKAKDCVSPLLAEEINSILYEDVPSPGKFSNEPQVNVVSQSTNELYTGEKTQTYDSSAPVESDLDDSNGLGEVKPSVTSTDTPFQCSTLNWSGGLDVNLDELQVNLGSDEEAASQADDVCETRHGEGKPKSSILEDLEANRVPTPEITAQRYRSQTLNIALELSDDTKKLSRNDNQTERKTKVYSSASTIGSHSSKPKVKSKSRGDKLESHSSTKKSRKVGKATAGSISTKNEQFEKVIRSSESKTCDHEDTTDKMSVKRDRSASTRELSPEECHRTRDNLEVSTKHRVTKRTIPRQEKSPHKDLSQPRSHSLKGKGESGDSRSKPYQKSSKHEKLYPVDERSEHSNDARQRHRNITTKKHSRDEALDKTKLSVFQRLSDRQKASSYSATRSISPRSQSAQEMRKRSSRSPNRRFTGQRDRDRQSTVDQQSSMQSDRHYSNLRHLSSSRSGFEQEKVQNMITLNDRPSVVKTYETFHTSHRKGDKTCSVSAKDNRSKSPVRFPSPDITVVKEPKVNKPKPPLVVLSD